jgi:hypothetical protein
VLEHARFELSELRQRLASGHPAMLASKNRWSIGLLRR